MGEIRNIKMIETFRDFNMKQLEEAEANNDIQRIIKLKDNIKLYEKQLKRLEST